MRCQNQTIDGLYRLVADDDCLQLERAIKAERQKAQLCAEMDARLHGPLSAMSLSRGHVARALKEVLEGLRKVSSLVGTAELVAARAAIAREVGELGIAASLTDASVLSTLDEGGHAFGVALFSSATIRAYSGKREIAASRWEKSLDHLEADSYLRVAAKTNLGILAIEAGQWAEAGEHLKDWHDPSAPRNLRLHRCIAAARVLASQSDLEGAAIAQRQAFDLAERRGALEQTQVLVQLVRYLHSSGNPQEACLAASAGTRLVFDLEEERHVLAASALSELARAGRAASVSSAVIDACEERLKLSQKDPRNRHSGRSARRPRRRK